MLEKRYRKTNIAGRLPEVLEASQPHLREQKSQIYAPGAGWRIILGFEALHDSPALPAETVMKNSGSKARLACLALSMALLPSFGTSATPASTVPPAATPVTPNYAYSTAQNWAGLYAGAHVGGVVGEFTNQAGVTGPTGTGGDAMGGVQAGYNWQRGNIVFGGEGDASWIPFRAYAATSGSYDENWLMTFRGRVGYAFGNFLPYATAGLAVTGTQSNLAAGGSSDDVHAGLAAGGGVEYMCFTHWSVRAEYLYADAPNETSTINGAQFTGGSGNHVFRAALNYHFD
jgi:outer membrane immunogenic protein